MNKHWDPDRRTDQASRDAPRWLWMIVVLVIAALAVIESSAWRKAYLLTHGNPLGEYRDDVE